MSERDTTKCSVCREGVAASEDQPDHERKYGHRWLPVKPYEYSPQIESSAPTPNGWTKRLDEQERRWTGPEFKSLRDVAREYLAAIDRADQAELDAKRERLSHIPEKESLRKDMAAALEANASLLDLAFKREKEIADLREQLELVAKKVAPIADRDAARCHHVGCDCFDAGIAAADRAVRDALAPVSGGVSSRGEVYTPCDIWTLCFNAYSAGTSWGAKHPAPTDHEAINECSRYADAISPHDTCDSGKPFVSPAQVPFTEDIR